MLKFKLGCYRDGGQEEEDCPRCFRQQHSSSPPAASAVPAAAVPATPAVPAEAAAVPASIVAVGRSGPEVTGTSGSCRSTSSASTAGSTAGSSSCRTAGSSTFSHVLSLWPAGALRQLLPPEGTGRTAGAPSSAQGASTGSGEPRDGRVSGRGS